MWQVAVLWCYTEGVITVKEHKESKSVLWSFVLVFQVGQVAPNRFLFRIPSAQPQSCLHRVKLGRGGGGGGEGYLT